MAIEDKIRNEKLQYAIKREAAKMLALSSGKIDNYEHLTGKEILPLDQSRLLEQAKFTYSDLKKAFGKQVKTIEDQVKKQAEALKVQKTKWIERIFPKDLDNSEIQNKLNEIKELEEQINRNNWI